MRWIDDDERRARLGQRHVLAPEHQVARPADVANALTAVHGTDPSSTVLGIIARSPHASTHDVERALYDDRTIVRVLGMRRTIFVVNFELAPAVWSSFEGTVAQNQRRLLIRLLVANGINNPDHWILEAEQRLLAHLDANPESTSTQISSDDPVLGHRLSQGGPGGTTVTQSVASRLLTLMSSEGRVIRARPRGGWTSSQFTWVIASHWRADWPERPPQEEADAMIARSWLFGHGPATIDDLAWWTGWPKGRVRNAIDRAGGAEVATAAGPAFVLECDLEPLPPPLPWVALLPGLDSSTMGWRNREFYLGPHAPRLFDNVGNAGPTVWADGRIVGGWTQRESGEIALEFLEDIGQESRSAIESRAHELEAVLAEVRIKPRARRYTPSELALR